MKFYLRLEGVNLNNFVYDTQDLSTIRGGGLLLLDAVNKVLQQWPKKFGSISTGASSGLLSFEAKDSGEAEEVCCAVDEYLRTHKKLKHASFVVDVQPEGKGKDFVFTREALLARNRWRQMQQPTVAIPTWNTNTQATRPCVKDRLRLATQPIKGPNNTTEEVSESVFVRHEYGQEQKHKFYSQCSGMAQSWEFAHDLGELTADPTKGNLHHKMAVIYFDGNGFGKLQNKYCTDPDSQEKFDSLVKERRREALIALLESMSAKQAVWRSKPNGHYRLETLLWGGDELVWVVPAWLGWEVLTLFYTESQKWKFRRKGKNKPALTHAGGVVFCHHNAPIHRITTLAKKLAQVAKDKIGAEEKQASQEQPKQIQGTKKGRSGNAFAYMILESFDHVGRGLNAFLAERYDKHTDKEVRSPYHIVLPGNGAEMLKVKEAFEKLKHDELLPKRKLHQIAQALQNDPSKAAALIKEISTAPPAKLDTLRQYFQSGDYDWLHIVELWDYIGA